MYQWSKTGLLEKYCDGSNHPCRAKCSAAVGYNAAFESLSSLNTDVGSVFPLPKAVFYKTGEFSDLC